MRIEANHSTVRQVDGMKRIIRILGLSVVIMAGAQFALATQLVYMTPRQMGERAELVVAGTVTATESFWNEKRTKIFTRIEVAIDASYKGAAVPTVSLLQLGGTVNGIRTTVSGAIRWRTGEEVLLFLEPYTQGVYQVTGLSQGKYRIERDPVSGAAMISRPALSGVKIGGAPSSAAPGAAVEKVPLERFVAEALGSKD